MKFIKCSAIGCGNPDILADARSGKDVSFWPDIKHLLYPGLKYESETYRVWGCGAVMVAYGKEWFPDNSEVDGWCNYQVMRKGGKRDR